MEIITATINHLEEVADMFNAYRVWYRKPADLDSARAFLKARFENADSVIYLALDPVTGNFAGFTQLYPLFSSTRMRRMWLLNDLFVWKAYRGRGISKMLIERSKQLARETDACGIQLETEKTNTIGNQLYPATDFELETDVNFYFWTNPE